MCTGRLAISLFFGPSTNAMPRWPLNAPAVRRQYRAALPDALLPSSLGDRHTLPPPQQQQQRFIDHSGVLLCSVSPDGDWRTYHVPQRDVLCDAFCAKLPSEQRQGQPGGPTPPPQLHSWQCAGGCDTERGACRCTYAHGSAMQTMSIEHCSTHAWSIKLCRCALGGVARWPDDSRTAQSASGGFG